MYENLTELRVSGIEIACHVDSLICGYAKDRLQRSLTGPCPPLNFLVTSVFLPPYPLENRRNSICGIMSGPCVMIMPLLLDMGMPLLMIKRASSTKFL